MLDEAQRRALVERLTEEGWDQGSVLDWRIDLYLASRKEPLTAEAEATTQGDGPYALVFQIKKEGSQMVVVSQRCDIVSADEDLIEAIPLVEWPAERDLPGLNSTRYFVFDRDARLVADSTRRLQFEKTLLPTGTPQRLCGDDDALRSFSQWCARRYSRVAFANDFVATVGYALEDALRRQGKKNPEPRKALHSWRVAETQVSAGDPIDVSFLVVYDEEHEAAASVGNFVAAVVEQAQNLLPKYQAKAEERAEALGVKGAVRPHTIAQAVPTAMSQVSLRDLRQWPSFNLEHMTYAGEEIAGVEPLEEAV